MLNQLSHLHPLLAADLQCGVLPDAWCKSADLNALIGFIAGWLVGLIGGILAVVILVSAVQIVSSGGSPEAMKSAKNRLTQAAISLGLLISFRAILALIGV